MVNPGSATLPITCPACGSTSFQPIKTGFLIKATVLECQTCRTHLRPIAKGEDRYAVVRVGEGYSNCASLFADLTFTRAELVEPDLPVYSDAELLAFGKGELPEDLIAPDDLAEPSFELAADEKVMLQLENVYSWEDRLHPDSAVLRRPVQVEAGGWAELKPLAEPKYAHNVETLATGILTITSRRVAFESTARRMVQAYAKAVRVIPFPDGLGLTSPERNRIEYFKGNYHWPLVFSVVRGLRAGVVVKSRTDGG